jgi:hypothetical protein
MACYYMSVIHLSGNIWINDLYALVSESCESMVRHTADLGKCLCDAKFIYMFYTCYMKVSFVLGFSVMW